jgi:hypothetical protein
MISSASSASSLLIYFLVGCGFLLVLLPGGIGVDFLGICHSPLVDLFTVSAAMMAVNALCLRVLQRARQ